MHHFQGQRIDDVNGIVQRMREIDPDVAAVGPRHREYRLAMRGDAAGFSEVTQIDAYQFVMADRRKQ